jgi:chromosome partitioning protein
MASSFVSPIEVLGHISRPLSRVLTMANGKGGVGKTTTAANVGGSAALAGIRTLLVDLDPQGDLSRDLGYEPKDGIDLMTALLTGMPPVILKDVRKDLDVIAGGQAMEDIAGLLSARASREDAQDFGDMLFTMLEPIVGNYDLILLDTPPGEKVIVEGAFAVSTAVIIPTKSDDASLDGVERIGRRFVAVRSRNESLQVAGVILFGVGARSLRLERKVRTKLEGMLGEVAPVFATRIRNLESASVDSREKGLLFYELEGAAKVEKHNRLAALRAGEKPAEGMLTTNATSSAEEYEDLTAEILTRLNEIEGGLTA